MTENECKLVEDNIKLVHHILWKYYPKYAKDEDLIQVGMLALCNAAVSWNSEKSKFSSYACRCILNSLITEFKRRRKQLNTISMDTPIYEDVSLGDLLVGEMNVDFFDPQPFYNRLKPKEYEILKYLEMGYNAVQIAEKMGYTHQNISQYIRHIRYKWRKYNANIRKVSH